MKVTDVLGTAIRDILTQPVRSFLTIFAIIISSAFFVTLVSLGVSGRSALVDQFSAGGAMNTVVISTNNTSGGGLFDNSVQTSNSTNQKITDKNVEAVRAIDGVSTAYAQQTVWELKNFQLEGDRTAFVSRVIGGAQPSHTLAAGSWFADDDESSALPVVLGNSYARALGHENNPSDLVGKKITFTTVEGYRGVGATLPALDASKQTRETFNNTATKLQAKIIGVSKRSVSDNQLFIPMSWAHRIQSPRTLTLNGETREDLIAKNGYTSIIATTKDDTAVKQVATTVENMGYGTFSYQKQIDQINQLSIAVWIILGAVALISLLSGALGILNTLLVAINEQRHTISIWRASGASRHMIARLYITQAIVLGLCGAGVGVLIGYGISRYINHVISSVLEAQGLMAITLPSPSLALMVFTIAITTLLAGLAGLYPAVRAGKHIV